MSLQAPHKGHNSNINLSVMHYHIQRNLRKHTKRGKSIIIFQKSPYPNNHKACGSIYTNTVPVVVPEAVIGEIVIHILQHST